MEKTSKKRYLPFIYIPLGIIGVFLLWEILSLTLKTTLFPGIEKIFTLFFSLFAQGSTYEAIGGTILRLVISLGISLLVGTLFGVLGGVFERFRLFFRPFVTFLRTIPTAAVIFILIVLTKPVWAPIIIVFLVTFPLMYDAVVTGFQSVPQEIKDAAKVDGAKIFSSIFRVYLPLSKDYILLGLVQMLGLGMKVSLMSEILAGSDSVAGLGRMIYYAAIEGDVALIMAVSLIAVMIIGATDLALYFAKKNLKKEK